MFKRWEPGTGNRGLAWKALAVSIALSAGCAVAGTLHDPTRPDYVAGAPAASSPSWQLSSTLISPRRRLAVINGKTVGVGDRIGAATVVAIQPGAVRLRAAGRILTVELLSTTIKTAHPALQKRH